MNTLSTGAAPLYAHLYFYFGLFFLTLVVVVGKKQWKKVRYAVVKQFDDKPMIVISGVMSGIFTIIYLAEESSNIVNWHQAGAAIQHADVDFVVSVGLIVACLATFCISWIVLYTAGTIASYAENGRLHIELDRRLNEGLYQEYDPREVRIRQARQARQARRGVKLPSKHERYR